MGERMLINLSGGIDSVYCLHLMLEQGHKVLAHHIRLRNREGREQVEYKATQRVLQHFRSKGYSRQIKYHETGFDYGTINYVAYDLYIWSFMTAILLTDPNTRASTRAVVISSHLDSPFMLNPEREARRRALVRSVLGDWEPEWVFPIGDMTKKQIVQAIPNDLLNLCWWCRYPRRNKPCGRCKTCKQVTEALREKGRSEERPVSPQ